MDDPNGVEILNTIASMARAGHRWIGSPGEQKVRAMLLQAFQAAGLKTELQAFEYLAFESGRASIDIDGRSLPCEPLAYSAATQEPMVAPLLYVAEGLPPDFERLSALCQDVTKAIVVCDNLRSFVAYPNAEAAGARGFVLATSLPGNTIRCGTVRLDRKIGTIPALSIGGDDGRDLIGALQEGRPLQAALTVDCTIRPATGLNVIGRTAQGRNADRLAFSGHFDSFWNGIHAMDNLAGAATVVQLARTLPHRLQVDMEFIAFSGEELGCWGAAGYVNQPNFNPANIRALINLDTFGSKDSQLEIGVTTDLRGLCQDLVTRAKIKVDCWNTPPRAASDQQVFVTHGIPSIWLANCGADKNYHTPLDGLENMRPAKLAQVYNLAAALADAIASSRNSGSSGSKRKPDL